MDTKIEIKEEDPLSDQREFSKTVKKKTNSDAVVLDNDCDLTLKTEIKSETASFPDFCSLKETNCVSKHCLERVRSEYVTCSNNVEMNNKIEISLQSEGKLPQDAVMRFNKYNSYHEMNSKIKIKEEPWWLETEIRDCDDVKDGYFTPVNSPRLCTEAVSGDSSGDSTLSSSIVPRNITSFSYGKDFNEFDTSESIATKILPEENHVNSKYPQTCVGKTHIRVSLTHKDERSYKCNICECSFMCALSLKRHNLTHEVKKPHKCVICEKCFTYSSDLKRHKMIHEGKKPHKCIICEKSYTQLSHLKTHNLIHEGKKPHKCETCGKCFTFLSSLKRHNLLHEGEKLHECEICEKRFSHLSHLKYHNLIHEGKKPHKCGVCEKCFASPSDLRRHNLIHEGKKLHKCVICEKSYTQLSHLKTHNLIHEGKKPHKCEICKRSFTHLPSLKVHNLIHERR